MNSISYIPSKDITNKKHCEQNIFISPYSNTTSFLQLSLIQSRKKKLKNLKRVLTSAAGMADLLETVASVFSDKRVLFINSVPFLSIFSLYLYFSVSFRKLGYFYILRSHNCCHFCFFSTIYQKSPKEQGSKFQMTCSLPTMSSLAKNQKGSNGP